MPHTETASNNLTTTSSTLRPYLLLACFASRELYNKRLPPGAVVQQSLDGIGFDSSGGGYCEMWTVRRAALRKAMATCRAYERHSTCTSLRQRQAAQEHVFSRHGNLFLSSETKRQLFPIGNGMPQLLLARHGKPVTRPMRGAPHTAPAEPLSCSSPGSCMKTREHQPLPSSSRRS